MLSSSDGMSSLSGWVSATRACGANKGLTLSQSCLTTSRLAEYARACAAEDDGLRMREDGGNGEAA